MAEHENIIPDYTQNIPTYVRRDSIYNGAIQGRPTFAQYNNTDYRYYFINNVNKHYPSARYTVTQQQQIPQQNHYY